MKKPIVIALASLLALQAGARVGDEIIHKEGLQKLYFVIVDEEALTCITKPGTDKENHGNNIFKSNFTLPEKVSHNNKEYTVVGIGDYGFCNTTAKTVTLPSTVTSIGKYAFHNCDMEEIILPEGLTSIDDSAFDYCRDLVRAGIAGEEKSVLPPNLTYLGTGAFRTCWALADVVIPGSIGRINGETFCDCEGMKSVEIGEGITLIENYAFQNCKKLSSITIPEGVTNIWHDAFSGCIMLEKVSLPSSLIQIDYRAFIKDKAITDITVAATVPPFAPDTSTFPDENYANATLWVPGPSVRDYQAAGTWMEFMNIRAIDGDDPEPLTLTVDGEMEPLKTGIDYEMTGNLLVMWKSSNVAVATVDADGVVTAVGPGTANITALVPGYTDLRVTRKVTVSRDEATGSLRLHESETE